MKILAIILLFSLTNCTRFNYTGESKVRLVSFKRAAYGYDVRFANGCGDTIESTYHYFGKLKTGALYTIAFDTTNINKKGIAVKIKPCN